MYKLICQASLIALCAGLLVSCASMESDAGNSQTQTYATQNSAQRVAASTGQGGYGRCGDSMPPAAGLELSIAQDLFDNGTSRSALAHLEALDMAFPDARLLEADVRRDIGDIEASNRLYLGLVNTCLGAAAYHGLALNAFETRQLRNALQLMMQARQASPTDARIRNDLGYIMMLDGNHAAAEAEFLTALELDARHSSAAQNLVLLYLHRGQHSRADHAASSYRLDQSTYEALRSVVAADNG